MKKVLNIKQDSNEKYSIYLYGDIVDYAWWNEDVSPEDIKTELSIADDASEIDVRINSGGGSVFAGMAIYSLLKSHKATINVYIDGIAASIASVIAMAGDNVYMHAGSMLMIHNPWTITMGDSNSLRKEADVLDKIRDSIIAIYKTQSILDEKVIKKLVDKESWFTASEAKEMGFITEILYEPVMASLSNSKLMYDNNIICDLSKFANAVKVEEHYKKMCVGSDQMELRPEAIDKIVDEVLNKVLVKQTQSVQEGIQNKVEAILDETVEDNTIGEGGGEVVEPVVEDPKKEEPVEEVIEEPVKEEEEIPETETTVEETDEAIIETTEVEDSLYSKIANKIKEGLQNSINPTDLQNKYNDLKINYDNALKEISNLKEYREDYIKGIVALGVKAQGNLFPVDSYNKFLNTLAFAELLDIKNSFNVSVDEKFNKVTVDTSLSKEGSDDYLYAKNFETDTEFTNAIADKAVELAKESGGKVSEIQKELYNKYKEEK